MEYNYLKLIHLVAVMLFLGNIITGLFWLRWAVKTKKPGIINFTIKGIIRADKYFTIPGVIIITAGGIATALYAHLPVWGTPWIRWPIILFAVSGLIFGLKLAPLQKKMSRLTANIEPGVNDNWEAFNKAYLAWDIWGFFATLTPLAAFVMMVLKLPA